MRGMSWKVKTGWGISILGGHGSHMQRGIYVIDRESTVWAGDMTDAYVIEGAGGYDVYEGNTYEGDSSE